MLIALQTDDDAIIEEAVSSTDWIRAGLIFVGTIILAVAIAKVLRRLLSRGIGTGFAAIIMARLTSYLVFLIGLSYALTTLGVRVGPLLGALGLGGLVLALALQGVVENFVSSIILQARRPFTVGDTVKLDGYTGVVADIDSRTTFVRSLDGEQVRFPNAQVAKSTIVNLTREPKRRSELTFRVTYDTDLQQARAAILGAVSRVPRVLTRPAPMINVSKFDDSGILMSVLYWHKSDVPSELAARTDLMVAVHQALAAENVEIAVHQVVVWNGEEHEVAYEEPPAETIETAHPGIATDEPEVKKKISVPHLRRPGWAQRGK